MSGISALKGFRTQFLYSLYYILSNNDTNFKFRLEGIEDLDVLDQSDNLLKIIQVKNLSTPLVLSSLLSQKPTKTSFLKRYVEIRKNFSNVEPVVISFGDVSDELKKWKVNSNKREKNNQFKEHEWIDIKNKVSFLEVNECILTNESIKLLKSQYASIDPIPALDHLLYWLSVIAEKQHIITKSDLFNQIEKIAQYLSERISSTNQYGIYVSPLHLKFQSEASLDLLQEEFYNGINSRFDHIVNNLDVERIDLMQQIKSSFKNNNIVILHGVSGQGKSTLAYRYAFTNAPTSLVYELNIQDNPEQSRESIINIKAMTKSLETPVLFLLHVSPNSTEWIKILQEFSVDSITQFLITIRQEDWYKAQSSGIKFLYDEIEIILSKAEASEIYNRLNEKHIDLINIDFEEAWIKFGEYGPLLEFVYAITKGQSLENTLKHQFSILQNETNDDNIGRLILLRLVCLADAYGARVNVEKIKNINNIQEAIGRLEKEYLVKLTDDKKYIAGLHSQRSKVLLNDIFDEFITEKKVFALEYINFIEDKDVYFYILNLFREVSLTPIQLITRFENDQTLSWAFYNGIFKSLLWAGIDEYLNSNQELLTQAYTQLGDSWVVLIDLYFGETNAIGKLFESSDFIDPTFKHIAKDINSKFSNKDDIFKYIKLFLIKTPLPSSKPKSSEDWSSCGQLSFWLNKLNDQSVNYEIVSELDYKYAFETLDVNTLASLMCGMTYQQKTIELKYKYLNYFTEKLRLRYSIPELIIRDDEVRANYIIDINQNDEDNKSFNDRSMEIISLLRKAFPEKTKYSTQGYGHRLPLLGLPFDGTHKEILSENVPLEQWVEINTIIRKRFEYSQLPTNWEDFNKKLNLWESELVDIIKQFNESFNTFYCEDRGYKYLIQLVNNANYKNLTSLKAPQSVVEPFGIAYDKISAQFGQSRDNLIESKLNSRYENFFKSYSNFRLSIENFVRQSGGVLYHKMKTITEPEYIIDENIEHLSQRNLFDAITKSSIYQKEKKQFSKFTFNNELTVFAKLLTATAYTWNQFLANRLDKQNNISQKGDKHINKLKSDFESKLIKECKIRSKQSDFILKYQNDISTNHNAIIRIEVEEPFTILFALEDVFKAIKNAVEQPEYTSLKYLMLETSFSEFKILPLVKGKTLNNQWNQIPLYAFHTYELGNISPHHFMLKTINDDIIQKSQLLDWSALLVKIKDVKHFSEQFMKIRILNEHLLDMKDLIEKNIDAIAENMLTIHFKDKMQELQTAFQFVLDYLAILIVEFPLNEELYTTNEFEKEYFDTLFRIKDNLFPVPKGEEEDYQLVINIDVMSNWSERLKTCSENVGMLYFLLCGKYINQN
jgi:hypothetical protein